jgi:hypothetical protein
MRRKSAVETIDLPHEYAAFADARTDDLVRRCCADPNIIESIARSCYLQGVWDGVQVAIAHPELLTALQPPGDADDRP